MKNFKIALMTSFTLLLKTGIIEGIDIENNTEVGKKCYMPHSAVVREDKDTTKSRIVHDASSKSKDLSLNESLDYEIKGFSDLLRILVRFSVRKIRIIRDIEKAFLRIAMKGENGDVLRFNWIKNVTSENDIKMKLCRFTKACFGLISSMFHLEDVIDHHLQNFEGQHPELVEKNTQFLIRRRSKDAAELYHKTKEVFKKYR